MSGECPSALTQTEYGNILIGQMIPPTLQILSVRTLPLNSEHRIVFPGSGITTNFNPPCTTTTQNGISCVTGPNLFQCPDSGTCSGTLTCSNTPGSHSAYAYIDVDGFPFFDGINELHNNVSISIYPNPMTSFSIIEINGEQNAEVAIYDMVGKLLLRKKLVANKTEIQKGDLAQGVYLVRVNQYIKKLVVE